MTVLAHIADRVIGVPLLITPQKAQVIAQVLSGRLPLGGDVGGGGGPDASRFVGDPFTRDFDGRPVGMKPYRVSNGVGILSVVGSLVNRGAWIGANSGLVSYEGIQFQLAAMRDDPEVESALIDLATPGGEAVGAFETAAAVRDLAKKKRTVAVVNGMAASAGYAIASAATEIITTATGVSGSIGVVLMHADFSRQLDREGITPTLIHAGAHKVDGNPFEPLSDEVQADLQEEVNAFYTSFLATVAAGRGSRLTVASARKTEARTFVGQKAVEMGLADRVGSFESALAELTKRTATGARPQSNKRGSRMDNENNGPKADATFTSADMDRARADARTEGHAAGVTEAMTRINAITSAEGIRGNGPRLAAALMLASEAPSMAADKVVAFVTSTVAADTKAGAGDKSLAARDGQPDSLAAAGNADSTTPAPRIDFVGNARARIAAKK